MNELWVDKYAPNGLDEYIFKDENVKAMVASWLERGWTDNLLLVGPAGTGKTSLARVLMNELDIDDSDYIKLNASREGNIDTIRNRITNFIQSGGWGSSHKYIILDEADGMTHIAQPALRSDMEDYSETVRWIMTANNLNKIIPPLQDRCTVLQFDRPDKELVLERLIEILDNESVSLDDEETVIDILNSIIDTHYPSVRGCIRSLQAHVQNGKLVAVKNELVSDDGWKVDIYKAFEKGDVELGRKMIVDNLAKEEIDDYLIWLSNHLELTPSPKDAIVKIHRGLVDNRLSPSPEITLSATLVMITQGI